MIVPSRIEDFKTSLRKAITAINGELDFYDNLKCRIVDVADTGLANTTFTVDHNLGRKPVAYIWNIDRAGIVYDQSRATWTDSQMTLRCSVANAVLKLIVF